MMGLKNNYNNQILKNRVEEEYTIKVRRIETGRQKYGGYAYCDACEKEHYHDSIRIISVDGKIIEGDVWKCMGTVEVELEHNW